jgi:endonuclease G
MPGERIDPYQLQTAIYCRDRAAAFHLHQPGVTLVDVGYRYRHGKMTDELAVRVHVEKKKKGPQLEALDAAQIPNVSRIGFTTDVMEGKYRLHGGWFWPQPPAPTPYTRRSRPLKAGISISNEYDYNFGTLGGFVRDRKTGEGMILGCWHVLVNSAYRWPGVRIFQPAAGDGGWYSDSVAAYSRDGMKSGVDAAVARLLEGQQGVNDEVGLGVVTGVAEPRLGMVVTKSGRASKITTGVIDGVGGVTPMSYAGLPREIRECVHIAPLTEGETVSAGGDSGAWWLTRDDRRAVGLHFAGSDEPEFGLAMSMPAVLNILDVDIA